MPDTSPADPDDPITVRAAGPSDVDTCRRLLNEAYGRATFTEDWYRWKHLESPWGASTPYLATDGEEAIGVVFGLPWRYRTRGDDGSITEEAGVRFVDGATRHGHRGRRVLPVLCYEELRTWGPGGRPGIVLATATPAARRSHVRNGAATLTPIPSAFGVPRSLRPARLLTGDEVIDTLTPDLATPAAPGVLATAWDPATLRWRTDPRSAHDYLAASLAAGDAANGLVYRIDSFRNVRVLVPVTAWGTEHDRRRLVGAVAVRHGCPAVLDHLGPSVAPATIRPVRSGARSVVCVWDLRTPAADASRRRRDATRDDAWQLTMADLEGVI